MSNLTASCSHGNRDGWRDSHQISSAFSWIRWAQLGWIGISFQADYSCGLYVWLFYYLKYYILSAWEQTSLKFNCDANFTKMHLTHWSKVTHICVGNITIIGSDNALSPDRRQAIIWTNAGIVLIGPLGINFNEILIRIKIFSFKKIHLKMLSAKWRPFCLGLSVLKWCLQYNGQFVQASMC